MSEQRNSGDDTEATPRLTIRGLIARFWRFLKNPTALVSVGALLGVGFSLGVVFWGGFNWSLELTNTEAFCISCHEMERNVFREYKGSVHDANASGVRATCPDCHVPKTWVHKIARKIRASNELWHHFLGTVATREKFEGKRLQLAKNEWRRMKETDSRECRNCHTFEAMDVAIQESRAREGHLKAIDSGRTCIDCHKGIAHELPEGALEAEQEMQRNN